MIEWRNGRMDEGDKGDIGPAALIIPPFRNSAIPPFLT